MILEDLAIKYGTDKKIANGGHGYTRYYSRFFEPIRFNNLNVLELGVREGWSLRMWHEYFPNSFVWGIDNNEEKKCPIAFSEDKIRFRTGLQDDYDFLTNLSKEAGAFDIIIDDCSHISDLTIKSFEILWPLLKSGGIYVIEDLHVCTMAPIYLRHGPSALQYIDSLDKESLNIHSINLYNNKICFLRKL